MKRSSNRREFVTLSLRSAPLLFSACSPGFLAGPGDAADLESPDSGVGSRKPDSGRVTVEDAGTVAVEDAGTVAVEDGSTVRPRGTARSFLNTMLAATGGSAEVYHVTSLEPSGPGSFRDAITGGSSDVTRVVVFDVSGVCNLGPKITLAVNRSNLFVAGETAPDPGDGRGRGFHLRGAAIRVRSSNVVFRHITVQPTGGAWHDASDDDLEGIYWYDNRTASHARGFVCQNVSFYGTTDEALAPKSYDGSRGDAQITSGVAYVDCNIVAALNHRQTLVDRDGQDPATLDHKGGHSYGAMVGYGTFGVLFLRNLMQGAVRRSPQFGGSSDGLIMNNVVFGAGRAGGGFTAVPFIVDARTGDGADTYSPHTRTRLGILSNYVEAGPYSDPWSAGGHVTMNDGRWATDNRFDLYEDRGTRHLSHFPRSGIVGKAATLDGRNSRGPEDQIQTEWFPTPEVTRLATRLEEPPLALPDTPILGADEAMAAVKAHAGAWPAQRHALDRWYLRRFESKDFLVYGRVPEQRFLSTRVGAAAPVPPDPFSIDNNGLTSIENWLHERHLAAGGYNDYAAAEWFSRPSR